jgi:capsular polysaccharide transport system permease protein
MMIASARRSWAAFSNWRLMIWVALPQLLSRQTRGSKVMFMVAVCEPLIVVTLLYAIRGLLKQNTPNYGTSLFLFYASGMLPFYLFMRVSTRTRTALSKPNSLLPGISALDVYIATVVLVVLINITMMIVIFYGMWLYGIDQARPVSIVTCAIPVGLLIVMGFGIGMINNVVNRFFPLWSLLYRILTRGLIFLSGVMLIVDLTPLWLRNIVIMNPLAHAIEWFRLGVYGTYPHNTLDRAYLIEWAVIALFLGFVVDRAAIRRVQAS